MKKILVVLALLCAVACSAQDFNGLYAPLDGNNIGAQGWSGQNQFFQGIQFGPVTVSQLSTLGASNLTMIGVSDAVAGSNPCIGGGAGAFAQLLNGVWNCGSGGSVLLATNFPGADAGLQINAALKALPSTGGIVDARGLTGLQISSSNIFSGVTAQGVTVLLGAATYRLSQQWVVPNKSRLIGVGRGDANSSNTVLQAVSTFPVSTPLIRLGSGTIVFGTQLQYLTVDCNNISGCTGVYSTDLNEQSGLFFVLVVNYSLYGVNIDGSVSGDTGAANFTIQNVETYGGTNVDGSIGDGGASMGMRIKTQQGTFGSISDCTLNGSVGHPIAIGFYLDNTAGGTLRHIHAEQVTTGIQIGDPSGAHGVRGVFASDLSASVNYLNAVTINHTATRSLTIADVSGYTAPSGNTLVDNINSITLTNETVGLYVVDDQHFSGLYTLAGGGMAITDLTVSDQIHSSVVGVAPLVVASQSPVLNMNVANHPTLFQSGFSQTLAKLYTNIQSLSGGTGTHTFANGFAYTSTGTFGCTCTDQTSANACKAVPASANTVTVAGTGSDVLWLSCSGH